MPLLKREETVRKASSRDAPECPRLDGKTAVNGKPSEPDEGQGDPLEAQERACPDARLNQGRSKRISGWRRHPAPRLKQGRSRGTCPSRRHRTKDEQRKMAEMAEPFRGIEPRTNPGETRELRARRKASNKERTERNCPDEGKEKTR